LRAPLRETQKCCQYKYIIWGGNFYGAVGSRQTIVSTLILRETLVKIPSTVFCQIGEAFAAIRL